MPLLLSDLDDTILDRAGAFALWTSRFVDAWDLPSDAPAWIAEQDHEGRRARADLFELVRERFRLSVSVEDLTRAFYRDFLPLFKCDKEVRASLVGARSQGWRIAIVTNGSPSQELKILAAGLDQLVDAWCISGVEGWRKPDRRLLEIAAERCSESLDGAWFIGDSADADVGAAAAAGMSSIWLRRGRTWPRRDYSPTLQSDSFPEAMGLLPAPV